MNCTQVKELLSAYYDVEVAADQRAAIAEHLHECAECSAECACFEQLSGLVQTLATPAAPSQLGWNQLQRQLDAASPDAASPDAASPDAASPDAASPDAASPDAASPDAGPTGERTIRPAPANRAFRPGWLGKPVLRPVLAVAALLLVVLGWFAVDLWSDHNGHSLLASDVEQYVDEFQRDPDAAQRNLVSKFKGQPVDLNAAVRQVSYRPIAAEGLPDGYQLDAAYLLRMPCCNCLQTICRRSDGSKIVIFEYGEEQPVSSDDRSKGMAQCRGKNCCMVDINDKFAVSWKSGGHHVSLVGVRDQAEREGLAAWLK